MDIKSTSFKKSRGNVSRRRFITSCAACGACLSAIPLATLSSCKSSSEEKKLKIRVVYSLHELVQPRPDWPNIGFDFNPVIEKYNSFLRKEFPSYEFISTLAAGEEDAKKIVSQDQTENPDGYIVFQLNCWNRVVQTIAATGKPVLYVDYKYAGSGGFLVYTAKFLRDNQPNTGYVSSCETKDLSEAVRCFKIIAGGGTVQEFAEAVTKSRVKRTPAQGNMDCLADDLKTIPAAECVRRMQESRILAVRNQGSGPAEPLMGIPLEYVSFAEVNQAWENADQDEAKAIAEKWQKKSSEVIDVSFEEIQNSAAMYLGMKAVLQNHNANAITVNCLGGFYGNHIHAYPCLGFHELNNERLIGACECDVSSTATMVAFTTMTEGRPGYISDPVIDTSKRQIIYAHCVAPNKMFGPAGQENPYSIMTHSEDRQGAAVRSILPEGYMTTSMKINNDRKEIIFHQAKAVANDPDDRACRTKLCAEPAGDIEKLFTEWDRWGWHRVTFYGDLKEAAYELADATGFKIIEEA